MCGFKLSPLFAALEYYTKTCFRLQGLFLIFFLFSGFFRAREASEQPSFLAQHAPARNGSFDEDDILPDSADAAPGTDVVGVSAEQPQKP